MSGTDGMLRAGLLFGFAMALKERSEAAIMRLRKASGREEVNLDGLAKFRRTRGRKSALFVLR